MSKINIVDGTGDCFAVKVSDKNKLATTSVTDAILDSHATIGESYTSATGKITITSDSESALYYIKNNEDEDLVIDSFNVCLEATTGGSGNTIITVYRNPTGGTLISGGTNLPPLNKNFGSAASLLADSIMGAEGSTISGGGTLIEYFASTPSRVLYKEGAMVLKKGNTFALAITPPTGNTSMGLCISVQMYRKKEEV